MSNWRGRNNSRVITELCSAMKYRVMQLSQPMKELRKQRKSHRMRVSRDMRKTSGKEDSTHSGY